MWSGLAAPGRQQLIDIGFSLGVLSQEIEDLRIVVSVVRHGGQRPDWRVWGRFARSAAGEEGGYGEGD